MTFRRSLPWLAVLADFPLRDWSAEPQLPWPDDAPIPGTTDSEGGATPDSTFTGLDLVLDIAGDPTIEPRLVADVRRVLAEVGKRVAQKLADYYPEVPRGVGNCRGPICGR